MIPVMLISSVFFMYVSFRRISIWRLGQRRPRRQERNEDREKGDAYDAAPASWSAPVLWRFSYGRERQRGVDVSDGLGGAEGKRQRTGALQKLRTTAVAILQ